MPLKTRIFHAIQGGELNDQRFVKEGYLGLQIPRQTTDTPVEQLDPINIWEDKVAYKKTAAKLKRLFEENFRN